MRRRQLIALSLSIFCLLPIGSIAAPWQSPGPTFQGLWTCFALVPGYAENFSEAPGDIFQLTIDKKGNLKGGNPTKTTSLSRQTFVIAQAFLEKNLSGKLTKFKSTPKSFRVASAETTFASRTKKAGINLSLYFDKVKIPLKKGYLYSARGRLKFRRQTLPVACQPGAIRPGASS